MPLQYCVGQQGNRLLQKDGCFYVKEREGASGKLIWKCSRYFSNKCPARLHTLGNEIVFTLHEHNHAGDAAFVQVKNVVADLKERAASSREKTMQIVTQSLENVDAAVSGRLPAISCLKRSIQRQRVHVNAIPPQPRTVEELIIPEEFKVTLSG